MAVKIDNPIVQGVMKYVDAKDVVLDVCAGTGDIMRHIPCAALVAVDISAPDLLKFREVRPNIIPVCMDALDMIDPDVAREVHYVDVDTVTCLDGIEHFEREDAIRLLDYLELISVKTIIFTPEGFVENPTRPTDPRQVHRCGFDREFFLDRGYELIASCVNQDHPHNQLLWGRDASTTIQPQ